MYISFYNTTASTWILATPGTTKKVQTYFRYPIEIWGGLGWHGFLVCDLDFKKYLSDGTHIHLAVISLSEVDPKHTF